MHTFLLKIGTVIVGLLTALGMYQAPVDFGSQLAVGGETYFLGGSGTTATQNTINLTKFGYTNPDGTFQKFSMTNFGTLGCGTFEPGNMKGKQEFVSFTGVTQNSDGTAQLTGVSRGLERFSPYTASTTLQTNHAGSTKFVISNSPPCFYENYVTINNAETITSVKTFSVSPIVPTPVGATEAVNKTYVDSGILAGAATSTESVTGIVRLATLVQTASSTATTANTPLVIQAQSATSTYNPATAPLKVVVTDNSGKIDGNFIDTTENYSWNGSHSFSATTTFGGATTTINSGVVMPVTSAKPLKLNGLSFNIPSTRGASSTVYMEDGTGNLTPNNIDWQLLGETILTGSSNAATTTIAARKNLRVVISVAGESDNEAILIRFNGDFAANYAYRVASSTGTSLGVGSNVTFASLSGGNAGLGPVFISLDITNDASYQKMINGSFVQTTGGADLGQAGESHGVWNNTSAQITTITIQSSVIPSRTMNAGTRISIYGSDK